MTWWKVGIKNHFEASYIRVKAATGEDALTVARDKKPEWEFNLLIAEQTTFRKS